MFAFIEVHALHNYSMLTLGSADEGSVNRPLNKKQEKLLREQEKTLEYAAKHDPAGLMSYGPTTSARHRDDLSFPDARSRTLPSPPAAGRQNPDYTGASAGSSGVQRPGNCSYRKTRKLDIQGAAPEPTVRRTPSPDLDTDGDFDDVGEF